MGTSSNINIILPQSWAELTQKQMLFLFRLLAASYTDNEVKTHCLFKWGGIKIKYRYGSGYIVKIQKKEIFLSSGIVVSAIENLNWIDTLPDYPVRIDKIGRYRAIDAQFEGVPFEKYIICDNLYQGYINTLDDNLITEIAKILYSSKKIKLTPGEKISVFYWFASLKSIFSREFRTFLQPVTNNTENLLESTETNSVKESVNAQIRALTAGDITKEKQVLEMDTWRALTELEAKAKEYEHMKLEMSKYGK